MAKAILAGGAPEVKTSATTGVQYLFLAEAILTGGALQLTNNLPTRATVEVQYLFLAKGIPTGEALQLTNFPTRAAIEIQYLFLAKAIPPDGVPPLRNDVCYARGAVPLFGQNISA